MHNEPQPAKKPGRRFWPRFTLRILLAVVTLLCIGLALWTQRAREQKRVADQIRLSGGRVVYDFEAENTWTRLVSTFPFQDLNDFHFNFGDDTVVDKESSVPPWLLDLLGEDFFHTVVRANVRDCDELKDIVSLWYLRELTVGRGVNDKDIEHVSRLRHLKQLWVVSESRMTDLSLTSLAAMSSLEIVYIEGEFTSKGLIALAQSPSLREVRVTGCDKSVDEAVVEIFRNEGRVETLRLHFNPPDRTMFFGSGLGRFGESDALPVLGYGD